MTAVEEPVERFSGDRPVRVPLPPAVLGELTQDPLWDCEPVPAGVTHSDQVGDQSRQRELLRHRAHPPCSMTSSTSNAQQRSRSMSNRR